MPLETLAAKILAAPWHDNSGVVMCNITLVRNEKGRPQLCYKHPDSTNQLAYRTTVR